MVMENVLKENLCIKQAGIVQCIGYPFPAPGTIHHQPPFNSHSVASISLVVRKEIWMVGINRQEDRSLFKFNKNEALTSSINSLSSC